MKSRTREVQDEKPAGAKFVLQPRSVSICHPYFWSHTVNWWSYPPFLQAHSSFQPHHYDLAGSLGLYLASFFQQHYISAAAWHSPSKWMAQIHVSHLIKTIRNNRSLGSSPRSVSKYFSFLDSNSQARPLKLLADKWWSPARGTQAEIKCAADFGFVWIGFMNHTLEGFWMLTRLLINP